MNRSPILPKKELVIKKKKSIDTRLIGLMMAMASPLSVWCGIEIANKDYTTGLLLLTILSFLEYYISINWIEKTKS